MISWIVNNFRQAFCKHNFISKSSSLPTLKIKITYDREYTLDEYVTILYCEHCGYSKKIKEH